MLRGDERGQVQIRQRNASRQNRTADDDAVRVDQHDVTGFPEPNGMGRGGKEFLGIDYAMEHSDSTIPKTIHDWDRDGEDIGVHLVIETDVFDVEFTDALVVGALPPSRIVMTKIRMIGHGGDESALGIGEEQHLSRRANHVRKQLAWSAMGT